MLVVASLYCTSGSLTLVACQNKRGETVTSARAIDETTLKSLWRNNLSTPEVDGNRKKRGEKDPTLWTGRNIRVMLWLLYIISFLCLLRYDEALHIMWSDVILTEVRTGVYRLELRLAFRKTHQYGGMRVLSLSAHRRTTNCSYGVRHRTILFILQQRTPLAMSDTSICGVGRYHEEAWPTTRRVHFSATSRAGLH